MIQTHQDPMQIRNRPSNGLSYWQNFVERFYSPNGVLRQELWDAAQTERENGVKTFEVPTSALARYYWTHFNSGVQKIQMFIENPRPKELQNGGHYVECPKSSFMYSYGHDCHVRFAPQT